MKNNICPPHTYSGTDKLQIKSLIKKIPVTEDNATLLSEPTELGIV